MLPSVVHQVLDAPADQMTAVIGTWPEPAILVSGRGFDEAGRWSIYAAYPRLVFEATDRQWTSIDDSGAVLTGEGDPLNELTRLARRFDLAGSAGSADPESVDADNAVVDVDACPFQGGLIGFLGYDLAPLIERLPRRTPRDSRLPDLRFGLYDTAITVDNRTGEVVLHAWDLTGEGRDATERRGRHWWRAIRGSLRSPRSIGASRLGPLIGNFDPAGYLQGVRRAMDYIAAGDAFQINLSQRFTAHGTIDPLDLFLKLNSASPAPYSAFLRWAEMAVVSASPELFYQTGGQTVVTRPIKGTRPRGSDAASDRLLSEELATAVKDRAELTMIVDLEPTTWGGSVSTAVSGWLIRWRSSPSPRSITWWRRSKAGSAQVSDRWMSCEPSSRAARSRGLPRSVRWRSSTSWNRHAAASTQAQSGSWGGEPEVPSTLRSGRCSWRRIGSATRSEAASWPIPIPGESMRKRCTRAGGSAA